MLEITNQENDIENDIIESVEYIFKKRIYNIPEYQRGYKWSEEDVNALLNDINNFQVDEKDKNKFYCLQNITIKKQKDNIYDVIDGQQRLTTLSILLSYLGETKLLEEDNKYKIQYSIREESQSFLYQLLQETDKDYLNDKLEYIDDFDKDYDSQDVFHFCLAKHTIIKFFGNDDNKKENFKNKLLKNVKLIVNDVSSGNYVNDVNDVKGETIFKNLNSNKVALEYYDLIRAIFITRVKKEGNDIDLAEKRIKIGIDIDNMNIWWSDENVKKYFKMFSDENNISMLYDLYWKCCKEDANKNKAQLNNDNKSNNEALFKYLDNNAYEAEKILKEVIRFHNTMADWYEDKEIYHLLGFIGKHIKKIGTNKKEDNKTKYKEDNIIYIWKKWEENTTKESFKNEFKKIIREDLIKNIEIIDNDDEEDTYKNYLNSIENTNNNWYDYRKNDTIKLLVLMDIIKILNNKNIKHKLPVNYFDKNDKIKEDIEHIFSKTPNKKTTIKDAIDNIDLIADLADDDKKESLNKYKKELLKEYKKADEIELQKIDKLEEYIEKIREVPYVHSIGNLVLLNSNTNRSYGNISYVAKRSIIIEQHESGEKYIRNHTWNIFSKNIELKNESAVNNKELDKWTIKDIEITAKYIREKIEEFFDDKNN